jgi:CRP-like cAMP-binding protein
MWSFLIIAINIFQVIYFLYQKRFLNLSVDERKVFNMIGSKMGILNFKKLMKAGNWDTYPKHKQIITENEATERLFLLVDGEAEVKIKHKHITTIKKGNFIGEMSFLSGDLPSAHVSTLTPSKMLSWEKGKLRLLIDKNDDLRHEIHSIFSNDLILKLINQNKKGII